MNTKVLRRDFLKAVPAAAGALTAVIQKPAPAQNPVRAQTEVKLSGAVYMPNPDYPRQPKPFSEVTMKDNFWAPKIRTNAEVTIPFEFQKSAETGQPISNNVLEAAIYSLQTHPDAKLEAQVDARIQEIKRTQGAKPATSNSLFEVAAAYYAASGKRGLLDIAIKSADLIYNALKSQAPRFSGGERDAINCVQLYRATQEKRYLDLAKYYLDIRGLESSVNRSRHNQSYKPVLEQSEAVGHAVNAASLMVSLADVGVLTGIRDYFDAAQRIWLDAVSTKYYITGGIGSTGNEGVWLSREEYALGDTGPAGGLIFYINPNYAKDGWRYLEAAPFDQSAGAKWGCFRTLIPGARGSAVGIGKQNTIDILASCKTPGSAAELCANFTLNGIGGWFLPSADELTQMYVSLKLAGIGDFGNSNIADNYCYWSSTQRTADMANHLDFADNGRRRHFDDKDYPRRVRAARAF
jgi:hypothetical protein